MQFAARARSFYLAMLSSIRLSERKAPALRAVPLFFTVWITAILLLVGPIRDAKAQQTETIAATMNYASASLCTSPPYPWFATIADLVACMNQVLDNDPDPNFQLTGNMTPDGPDVTCLETMGTHP